MALHVNSSQSSPSRHRSGDVDDACEEEEDLGYVCHTCDREFVSHVALQSHLSHSSRHQPYYCDACRRGFHDANSFRYHLASKRHTEPFIFCPKCHSGFVSAAGLVKHVEMSSRCYGKVSNNQILDAVRRWEEKSGNPNIFTVPRICGQGNDQIVISTRTYATEASFDGMHYVCPVCEKKFRALPSLNQHLDSNAHEASEFRCKKCSKKFKELSALVAHVESEACAAMAASALGNLIESFKSMLQLMFK